MEERSTVHPHLRGAYVVGMGTPPVVGGSSPPTWGIRAYTGGGVAKISVHPHLRGAYIFPAFSILLVNGSSPPTWGIHGADTFNVQTMRFIPTYVGHTGVADAPKPTPTVHPHLRGAYHGF